MGFFFVMWRIFATISVFNGRTSSAGLSLYYSSGKCSENNNRAMNLDPLIKTKAEDYP
jgi:hypothetical protein